MVTSHNKNNTISWRAVFFGISIALGFLFTVGALAFAIKTSMGSSKGGLPSTGVFAAILVVAVIVLVLVYFIASYFAVRSLEAPSKQLALLHGLCSWSIMSVVITLILILFLAINSIIALESPLVFTDFHLSKPNVVTKIIPEESKDNLFKNVHQNKVKLALVAWASFFALGLGGGASVIASSVALKRSREYL